jgi:hypothetical protein
MGGGELWFFDNYFVPLAKKLKECGVFGTSCDEFVDCALDNHQEWKERGKEIVLEMLAEEEAQEDLGEEDKGKKKYDSMRSGHSRVETIKEIDCPDC